MSQKSKQKSRSKRISTVAASSAVRALRSIPRRRTSPWACLRASFAFRKKTTTFGAGEAGKRKVGLRTGSAPFTPSSRTSNASNYIGSAMCDWKVWHKENNRRLAAGLCSRYVNKSWAQFLKFTIFCCRLFGDDSNLWYGIERAHARHTRSSYGQSH